MESYQTTDHSPAVALESESATQTDIEFETETDTGTESESESAGNSNSYPSPEATYEQVVESAQLFFEKLKAFHSSFFASEIRFLTLGGKELDLYRLFVEVTSRGGLEKELCHSRMVKNRSSSSQNDPQQPATLHRQTHKQPLDSTQTPTYLPNSYSL